MEKIIIDSNLPFPFIKSQVLREGKKETENILKSWVDYTLKRKNDLELIVLRLTDIKHSFPQANFKVHHSIQSKYH